MAKADRVRRTPVIHTPAQEARSQTTETDRWELSADGKTLTATLTSPGQSKSTIEVYDRE